MPIDENRRDKDEKEENVSCGFVGQYADFDNLQAPIQGYPNHRPITPERTTLHAISCPMNAEIHSEDQGGRNSRRKKSEQLQNNWLAPKRKKYSAV